MRQCRKAEKIVAENCCKEDLLLIFATTDKQIEHPSLTDGMAQLVERGTTDSDGCLFDTRLMNSFFFIWWVVGGVLRVEGGVVVDGGG